MTITTDQGGMAPNMTRASTFIGKPAGLTVAGLITELQEVDQYLPVQIEGCDCTGNAAAVHQQSYGTQRYIIISRTDSEEWS